MVFAKVLCPSGNVLLQMIVAMEHMVRGWTAFTWKLLWGAAMFDSGCFASSAGNWEEIIGGGVERVWKV